MVDAHLTRDQNSWSLRREVLDGRDQARPVQPRHGHVRQDQVNSALLDPLESIFPSREAHYAVSAGFQHDFAVGERLFVVVNTGYGALWFHLSFTIRRNPASSET